MAEWAGIYKTGLATVAANGTTVTFQNAGNIAQAVRAGDRFGAHVGLGIRIAAMAGNVATLAQPWPGPAQAAAGYEIALTPYDSGYRQQLQVLLDRYGGAALGITWDNEEWTSGETYLSDTGLEHLGSTYRAIIEHTASAANEPGVSVNWQQAWRILAEKGDLSPEERAYLDGTKATATAAASAAIGAAQDTDQDRIATAADRVQTGQDRTQTGQDRTATGQDRAAIAGAAEATAADRVATGQDREKTTADATATAADRVATGQDRTATGQDRTATGQDRTQTGQDKEATAADVVKTGQDRAAIAGAQEATAADREQTALDRIATGQDRTATNTAADTAVDAAQAASEDATATAADRVQTGQDRTQTGQDRTATGQDKEATAADRIATGEDRDATGQDKAATAADRVQTGQDRLAAAASAQQAAETASAVNPDAVNTRFNAIEGLVGGKADQSALEALGSSQAAALVLKAPLAGPVFTDIPRAPTPAAGNNTDQVATTAFVQALFNGLVNGAPGFLDQFNEFAAAVGNDPNFATTILNALAGKQPLDSDLTAIASLATHTFGRSVLTVADASAMRTLAGIVIGTHVQAYDADLAAIATLTTQMFGRSLLTLATASALRTAAELGSAATANTGDFATAAQGLLAAGALAAAAKASAADVIAGTDDIEYLTAAALAVAGQAVTFNPSSINLAALVNGKVTLTGNVIFSAPASPKEQTGYLYITQDATGNRIASWNTFWDFGADGPPTLSKGAGVTDLVTYTVLPGATKALCSFKAGA